MLLDFNNHELAVHFIGRFNASNLLAVFGAAVLLGKKEEDVLVALSTLQPVAGRFDAVRSPKGITAIVDYAHTPDALINVLNAIHGVLEGKGKVITVVGAGGNRDKGKRPIMAKEAAKASDRVIITSDNPRFEEPQDIINDMLAGLDKEDMQKTISIKGKAPALPFLLPCAIVFREYQEGRSRHESRKSLSPLHHHRQGDPLGRGRPPVDLRAGDRLRARGRGKWCARGRGEREREIPWQRLFLPGEQDPYPSALPQRERPLRCGLLAPPHPLRLGLPQDRHGRGRFLLPRHLRRGGRLPRPDGGPPLYTTISRLTF